MSLLHFNKLFCKDISVPIPILDEPYFSYFLDLYEKDYQAKSQYTSTLALATSIGIDNFLSQRRLFQDSIINATAPKLPLYEFTTSAIQTKFPTANLPVQKELFVPANLHKEFLAFDLVTANFQSLAAVNPALVNHKLTYQDFAYDFTHIDWFCKSKYSRQVIFGMLNPKAQAAVQKGLMSKLHATLTNSTLKLDQSFLLSSDELIVPYNGEDLATIQKLLCSLPFNIRLSRFKLSPLYSSVDTWYLQTHASGRVQIRCVPQTFFAQAYKFISGQAISPNDLSFIQEHLVAQFVKPLEFSTTRSLTATVAKV